MVTEGRSLQPVHLTTKHHGSEPIKSACPGVRVILILKPCRMLDTEMTASTISARKTLVILRIAQGCFALVVVICFLAFSISVLIRSRVSPADIALLKIPFLNSLQESLSAR
jgi:hypothetical protein